MDNVRNSLNLGLLYSLPLLLWAAGQIGPTPAGAVADVALRLAPALLLLQALALAVLAPAYAWNRRWQEGLSGLLMVLLVPLPLVAVIWLSGTIEATSLLGAQLGMASLALLLLALGRLAAGIVPGGCFGSIAAAALQTGAVAAVWMLRHAWLSGVGL